MTNFCNYSYLKTDKEVIDNINFQLLETKCNSPFFKNQLLLTKNCAELPLCQGKVVRAKSQNKNRKM